MSPGLKVCGMKDPSNILELAALKPDYMGFIFYPASKRYVEGLSPDFLKSLPADIKRIGVFVDEELPKVAEMATLFGLNAVQLHGNESAKYGRQLKDLLAESGVEIIKAFGIDASFDFDRLKDYVSSVDYFLFDTQTPAHGGSGIAFDWSLLAAYVLDKPYFLSGGIGMESLPALQAIRDERLHAIDVNSKFELAPGLKDIDRLIEFKTQL